MMATRPPCWARTALRHWCGCWRDLQIPWLLQVRTHNTPASTAVMDECGLWGCMVAWTPYSSFLLFLSALTSAPFSGAPFGKIVTTYSFSAQYLQLRCCLGIGAAAALCNLAEGSPELQTAIMLSLRNSKAPSFGCAGMRRSGRRAVEPGGWEASCHATFCL